MDEARPRRLPCGELPEAGGRVALDDAATRHARVLRLSVGDAVILIDGRGRQARATIVATGRGALQCDAEPSRWVPAPARGLSCVLGLPKGGKLEGVVRMLTELGVDALHLAQCARSVPRPSDDAARMSRLRRVALEACVQSGQARAPELHALAPLREVAARAPEGSARVVCWEEGGAALDDALAQLPPAPQPVQLWAAIGPEGGFERAEIEALAELGYRRVGLGPGILRVETAAVVVAGLLLDRLGRLRD